MRLQTLLDVKVNDALEYFPELKVSVEKGGLRIRARSPIFAEYLEKKPTQEYSATKGPWAGLKLRLLKNPPREFQGDFNGLFCQDPDSGEPKANISWLFLPQLGEGIDITLKHPIGLNDLENYFTSACEQLQHIYVNHVRTREFQVVLREVFESGPVKK